MDVILSISAWLNFIFTRLLKDAMFPIAATLIVFALFNRKEYKNTNMLRFILTALVISLISRYAYFVILKTKINTRYLYPVAFYVIILCVPGFPAAVRFLKYLTKPLPWIKEKYLTIFLLLVLGGVCIGKALHPPDRKLYIQDSVKIIKASQTSVPSILVSNLGDAERVAWEANAKLLPLSSVADIADPALFENALKILSSKSQSVFLLVDSKDDEFRKCFSRKKVKFPAELIFLKEFNAKHETFYSLYKLKH